ncbi:hypothetical protein BDN70DRAFT_938809 [Pholiota conissans]|uniref:Uncharacterized protein n=1 Tax=Pholiota conissans TaxID=109636 RepID=A0A9P5YPK7_9AGAR|nr:hypothetical protein BDN70DRAFT_938809 [Pholiota conissans]
MSHEHRGDTSVKWATKEELFSGTQAIKDRLILQLRKLSPSVLEAELKRRYVEGAITKIPIRTSMRVQEVKLKASVEPSAKGKQKEADSEEIQANPEEIIIFDERSVVEECLVSHPVTSPLSLVSRGT